MLSCKTDGNVEISDCSTEGLVCGTTEAGGIDCIGESAESCNIPPDQHAPRCDGEVAVTCVGYKIHHTDCSQRFFNRRCQEGVCVPTGTECSDDFNRCQGDNLQYCHDGNWHTVKCSGLGLGPCAPAVHGADCSPGGS
jgi:hypothetical protein